MQTLKYTVAEEGIKSTFTNIARRQLPSLTQGPWPGHRIRF